MQAMPSKNLAVSAVPLHMPFVQRRPENVGGRPFKLASDYTPAGDQPEARV
jgi:excinuclease ABC subunit B